MLRWACEENSITTEGMSWLSEVSQGAHVSGAQNLYRGTNPSKMLHFCVILLTVIPQILQNASFSCNFAYYHPSNPSKMLDFRVILLTIIPALGGMN